MCLNQPLDNCRQSRGAVHDPPRREEILRVQSLPRERVAMAIQFVLTAMAACTPPGESSMTKQSVLGDGHSNVVRETLPQRAGSVLRTGVRPRSGWPGVLLPRCRKFLSSGRTR